MKKTLLILLICLSFSARAQEFDFYGPQSFGELLDLPFEQAWTPQAISSFDNLKYVVILDAASKGTVLSISAEGLGSIQAGASTTIHEGSTYGALLRSVFQMVDVNTHLDNDETPLAGQYQVKPFLHSYYSVNANGTEALVADAGTFHVPESGEQGYLVIEFTGTTEDALIKAVNQFAYNDAQKAFEAVDGFTEKWLKLSGTTLSWTATQEEATEFFLADANGLIDLEIEAGSDFNPVNITYQPNATAALPEDINLIEDSKLLTDLPDRLNDASRAQLGTSDAAKTAASAMLDAIEARLSANGISMRYPKEFYLALRDNMLDHKIASNDIYGGREGYNTVSDVYFTNATDNEGDPHPFMVIVSHAVSTRPNQLVDVNRPPGAEMGVSYGESTVTRNGKLGEFVNKIPLRDYGLVDDLLDNDLSPYGDLASDFDEKQGTTTTKTVYNYAGLASVGVAVDGVTIYPAQNNNLRFAVEDGEVTHSGIHVGGGLELHYHADGHAYSGNGINLYNLSDYGGKNHPPVIGVAYDGIALFGRHEESFSEMVGYEVALDEFGGHDHGDGFGYHYHAHTQQLQAENGGASFNEHFLLIGAWKGNINNIPGFDEGKMNQFNDESIARYAGAPFEASNAAPVVNNAIADQNLEEGFGSITIDISNVFVDADGDVLTFTASGSDESVVTLSLSGNDLVITEAGIGSSSINLVANDGQGGSVADVFIVSVSAPNNNAPVVANAIADQSLEQGFGTLEIDISAVFSDADQDELSYSVSSSVSSVVEASIEGHTLTLTENGSGTTTISLLANDGRGGTTTDEFEVNVAPVTGLEGADISNEVKVFPNPSEGTLQVMARGITEIQLTDALGNVLLKTTKTTGQGSFELTGLPTGILLLRGTGKQVYFIKKVIIK